MKLLLIITALVISFNLFAENIKVSCDLYENELIIREDGYEMGSGYTHLKNFTVELEKKSKC